MKDLQTIGIGAGQMSRVDAVNIAVEKAAAYGHDLGGLGARVRRVLPVPGRAATSRSTPATSAIVQPGGSRRDQDVIDAVEKSGATMVLHRAAPLPPLR